MRIGINTGLAVVTHIRGESANATALGDTVNLASRLQTLAEPGTVLLSEATHRLVEGLVDVRFGGSHSIKGKAETQKVYGLDSIRHGTTRFLAAVGRGLTAYVGRERELEMLERRLAEARGRLRAVDIVAEPGMGKSRLLHEFRQRVDKKRAFILSASCSANGQQTPFLPFIELVRGTFQISVGEDEREVLRKLELGLTVRGLHSPRNLGLLLNLLGLKPPEGSLSGLDGLLIGLRTRDLFKLLLEARCRQSPVVLLIEDLHWIDSVSAEMLAAIVDDETELPLLLVTTRRPEYAPAWLDRPVVATLQLQPLPGGDIRRLVATRLGVDNLADAFVRLVVEKAEGNALFAEEIVSFLTERGVLRVKDGQVEFDTGAVAEALPASIQSLLAARVDRLAPQDRKLLQAASVIGRSFAPELLAAVAGGGGDIETRLAAIQALDLVYPEASGEYAFKHALVRDALYQSLLTGPRTALHMKVAEEVERRSGNRLAEVAEILAHHFSQTERDDKAFAYLAMAAAKSLRVYSLDQASEYGAAAIALLDKNPDCADDEQVADLFVNYTLCLNMLMRVISLTETVERFAHRLYGLGDSPKRILITHHYVLTLLYRKRYREAHAAQAELLALANRLGDAKSMAYALASEIHSSTFTAPKTAEDFKTVSRQAVAAASAVNDAYIQMFVRFAIGWEEFHRGRMAEAHQAADELMAAGRQMNDPRSIGMGLAVKAWAALTSDDYAGALEIAEAGIAIARTTQDIENATHAKIDSLVLLRRPEAFEMLRSFIDKCLANDWHWPLVGAEGIWGVALVLHGEIGSGIRSMKQSIVNREREGYFAVADWYRMFLCEIYLEIIVGAEKPPAMVICRNILTIAAVTFTAEKRICALVEKARQNPQIDPNGHHVGRCEMILGLLYKAKKKRSLAVQHLTEAKRIASQYGRTPMLAKIEAALAAL
jgi:hypothetical protein